MKNEYIAASVLAQNGKTLADEIGKYNPGIEHIKKESLATLAADAGSLVSLYGNLRQRLLDIHEERQRNEANSNS